jgi:glycosyltransferase involved in cell wall biosynthesis
MAEIRILHIIDSLIRGGAETLVVNTVAHIHQRYPEFKQYVVTLYHEGVLLPQVADKVEHHHLACTKTNLLGVVFRLNRLLKKWKIDVVHSHLLHSTFVTRLALPSKIRLVSTYHSVFYEPNLIEYAGMELVLDKLTYRRKYFTVFVSEAVKMDICKAVGITKNFAVLDNFASPTFTPSYRFSSSPALKMVMVGNLRLVKNQEIAIRALSYFKGLPVSLDIYGEGDRREFLKKLIKETQANVTLKGAAAMSSAILAEYDLFLMTSHHEGMPVALLEAMQTGLPSLLSALPMLQETAGEGAIYYENNSLESLIRSIEQILADKEVLKDLSGKALEQAKKFSVGNYVQSLVKIYQEKRC